MIFMRPDRVVVGVRNDRAKDVMRQLYRPLYLIEKPVLFTELETAELIKYAANAFLAVKISYINQMADLCEKVGANVHDVAKGMGLDNRIGAKFLHPGPGYGGSCFPKDTLALVKTAESYDSPVSIVSEVVAYNQARKYAMAGRVKAAFSDDVKGRKIAVLGLAFKPETDDMRKTRPLRSSPRLMKLVQTYPLMIRRRWKKQNICCQIQSVSQIQHRRVWTGQTARSWSPNGMSFAP